jgi:hypothetical protein
MVIKLKPKSTLPFPQFCSTPHRKKFGLNNALKGFDLNWE